MKRITLSILIPESSAISRYSKPTFTLRHIEKHFKDLIADKIIPALINLNGNKIHINAPESPFANIISEDEWRKSKFIPISRPYIPHETESDNNLHNEKKLVAPHFTILMKQPGMICCFLLESKNNEKLKSLLADITTVAQNRLPPICIIRDESLRPSIIEALGGRVFFPIVNEKDFIFIMQTLMFETKECVEKNRNPPNFGQVIANLHRLVDKWPLGVSHDHAIQVMRMMGMQIPQQQDRSVFRKGRSWESVGKRKMNELHIGIVGMGDRGINMLKKSIERGTYKQPKEKRVMDIVAICDIDPKALKNAEKKVNLKKIPESDRPRQYTSLEEFLRDPEVSIVNIVVPATIDQEVAREVVKAGKAPMIIAKDGDPRSGRGPVRL
ncbi:Gfo/Idh/MocA family oxidoreductase [Promethearchaeum syntrophicum]|uniref:Gfo/Idh/MocA family oxidoreductase n=1 Tax=Promethearchaeum syntrophicum TaxID=2594042 RepID=A0A5B9DEA7_9ARCH|nr:Gfo/Idh/MocA family oxidoreductase [Candidatus Prometheoarchaeum syntrophicum]QEE17355.1 Oxidoreductase family, NAD-binding Rossmann fold [Candidatus Prometheoarchaeum syntrophicum]